jgi:hypothetical protein
MPVSPFTWASVSALLIASIAVIHAAFVRGHMNEFIVAFSIGVVGVGAYCVVALTVQQRTAQGGRAACDATTVSDGARCVKRTDPLVVGDATFRVV